MIVIVTGLSGAGKTTLANLVEKELMKIGFPTEVLDGDNCRRTLCKELGFSKEDRIENLQRLAFVAKILYKHKIITILSAINPYENIRKSLFPNGVLVKTIWIKCSLNILIERDTKGLYHRALLPDDNPNKIHFFTGISDVYEPPEDADLIINTENEDILVSKNKIVNFLFEALSQNNLQPIMKMK